MTTTHEVLSHPFSHLSSWATETPTALLFSDGTASLTYADALSFARHVAATMRGLGVREGDRVAFELATGLQIVFTFAALHEGAATATFVGPAKLRVDWLFSSERHESPHASNTVFVDEAFLSAITTAPVEFDPRGFDSSETLCRIAFSSGTTGSPKAVPLTLGMVHNRALAANELVLSGTPFMCLLDLGTASGFHTLYGAVLMGATYFNPGAAAHNLRLVRVFGVTAIKASPIQISDLLEAARAEDHALTSLKRIYAAGSVVPVKLRHDVRAMSAARLFNLYGSTEVGRAVERELTDDDVSFAGVVVEGTDLEVVDTQGRPLPPNESGAVRYRRPHMATEYLDDPQATTAAFRDGWFYTGDEGELDASGRLALTGRVSDVINLGGVKVQPREVEVFALTQSGILDAAGFSATDALGVERFALAIVPDSGRSPGSNPDLRHVSSALSEQFGALAPSIIFSLPRIPRNSAGKVDRAELTNVYTTSVAIGGTAPGAA